MKFDKHFPTERLTPYIKYFVVSENETESEYKVFPSSGLVIGFQYKGQLTSLQENAISKLASAGITGMSDSYKIFKNSTRIGTILVYFNETDVGGHAKDDCVSNKNLGQIPTIIFLLSASSK